MKPLAFVFSLSLWGSAAEFKNLVKFEVSEKRFEFSDFEKIEINRFPDFQDFRYLSAKITAPANGSAEIWFKWYSLIPGHIDSKTGKSEKVDQNTKWNMLTDGHVNDGNGNDYLHDETTDRNGLWTFRANEPLPVRAKHLFITDPKEFSAKPRDPFDFETGIFKGWLLLVVSLNKKVIGMKASSPEIEKDWLIKNPWMLTDAKIPKSENVFDKPAAGPAIAIPAR